MASDWRTALQRWVSADLITAGTAEAIERWEAARPRARLRAPILVCLALGAVLLAAGVLLFVAAHWDTLSPGWRFGLVLSLLTALHALAAAAAPGFPALAAALHGVGSIALGGGIFLVGQIFNLQTHWPAGLLLWAAGAALGWLLLRQWPQLALLALLVPAWLLSEWFWLCERQGVFPSDGDWTASVIASGGVLLLSLTYFGAPRGPRTGPARRVLLWIGGLALIPATAAWTSLSSQSSAMDEPLARTLSGLPLTLAIPGLLVAVGGPLLLGWWLRGRRFWPLAVGAGWILACLPIDNPISGWSYAWRALGGVLLVVWGLMENRAERINMGTALVALTVIAFYFAEVMSRLERSLSLILLGVLCLAGGWALEWLRRRMLARLDGTGEAR